MTHFYESQTYVQASRHLDEACNWLHDIGINYSTTRLGRYQKVFSDLARCQLANAPDEFFQLHTFAEWVNAAHETSEIVRIYEGLRGNSDVNLTSRLRDALRGHELYVLDTDDRSGRDFTFELAVAAKFARHGFPINFGAEADVETKIGGVTFYVECKRLKSERKIQRRVKEGLKQLHGRYKASNDPGAARGILALSIGKTINSSLGLLEADDSESLGTKASLRNAAFIETYRKYWQKNIDRRTLGTFVVLDTPGMIRSEKKLVTVHEAAMNNSVPVGTPDYQLLVHVANNIFAKTT
ncbi:MAG: hypothetical protein Q8S96_22720 [Hydrogenophaga sp.]|uniref:hypothetical protein n=1 Tax=Hydrogenophaga sp. TaxID=1904254 RepID=UPI002725F2D4|nr:hypothetical protein [Hydrogenophaga sp.]MDO9481391.1 hypothetical protein [Hydrogenophaga sp.]MDP3347247.1 hypothetical protein [Hydrogenophaga sp.]MDP3808539.1 hypothetical protein [Hydrogenophaga sp.]MDP3927105.1 hypothetical protein [Hydrogenophaga sp.]